MRWDKWIVIFNVLFIHKRERNNTQAARALNREAQNKLAVTQISMLRSRPIDIKKKRQYQYQRFDCSVQKTIFIHPFFSLSSQIMSSKRKSPPTKVLDGHNNNNNISNNGLGSDSKLFHDHDDVMPATEIDLSIKSSSSPHSNNDIDTFNEQILNHNHRRGSPSPITEKFEHHRTTVGEPAVNHQQHNQMNGDKMSGNIKRRGGDIQVRENKF